MVFQTNYVMLLNISLSINTHNNYYYNIKSELSNSHNL